MLEPSPKIGLGIVTYNRPDFFYNCIKSVEKHLLGVIHTAWVYDDGSKKKGYQDIYKQLDKNIAVMVSEKNKGVATAKNWLLRRLYEDGCDFLFILEDDLLILSPSAVLSYVEVSKNTGIGHLMFAHHGPMNILGPIWSDPNGIELYPYAVGAWCMYTREVIDKVGYMDESFRNAYEHVEHTHRIALAELTTDWPYFADVRGSKDWIVEQEGSIENSSIRKNKAWAKNIVQGLIYWKKKDPANFPLEEELRRIKKQAGL